MILFEYINLKLLILFVTSQTVFPQETGNGTVAQTLDSVTRHINDLNNRFDEILALVNTYANTSDTLKEMQATIDSNFGDVLAEVREVKNISEYTSDYFLDYDTFYAYHSETEMMIDQVKKDLSHLSGDLHNLFANNKENLRPENTSKTNSTNTSTRKARSLHKDNKFNEGSRVVFETEKVCVQPVKNASPSSKGSQRSLFHTDDVRNYYDALRDCEIQGGTVFIPKTIRENEDWNNYARSLKKGGKFKEAFYPKIYYPEIKRFSWADCEENADYYSIPIRKNQFNPGKIRRFASSFGAICIKRRNNNYFSDSCESSRKGFAICQRI